MSKRINYIAIVLTTDCNYNCFYCKETGESIFSNVKGTWDFKKLKKVIKVAYNMGLTTFRITGGEPTMVEYLPQLIIYIMSLGNNSKIQLNTNGYDMHNVLLNVLEVYRERIDVMISVDSLSEYVKGIYYPKYLSSKIENLTKELINRKITTIYNIVVTKINYSEIKPLIDKSLALGVNIKILDLIVKNEYLGNGKQFHGKDAVTFRQLMYQELSGIKNYLQSISTESQEKYYIDNLSEIPVSSYLIGNQWVQVQDSFKGVMYSEECNNCFYYNTCYEGVFSPMLSVGEILHISGCMNSKLYYKLENKSEEEIGQSFEEILKIFESTQLIR